MSSGDQWPPVAAASKGSAKVGGNKRIGRGAEGGIKESQQQILSVVNEMFGSALEPDVILQVVQNCNWDLQPSIEGLITLTETIENPQTWEDASIHEEIKFPLRNLPQNKIKNAPRDPSTMKAQDNSIGSRSSDSSLSSKSEKPKRGVAKNRMDSFCGNIAKLKSSGENNPRSSEVFPPKVASSVPDGDFFFDDMPKYGASGTYTLTSKTFEKFSNFDDFPDNIAKTPNTSGNNAPPGEYPSANPPPWIHRDHKNRDSHRKEKFLDTKAAAEDKEFNRPEQNIASITDKSIVRKTESESLCGLKVQYRLSGMENSSDDDADVVIEDESSDYKLNLAASTSISVCQFLSPSTQTPPQRTQPEIHMINTPSPPLTPQRSVHDATLGRIKSAIQRGVKIMIILRGLPGSGKTTLARSIVSTTIGGNSAAYVFNTDDFFVTLGRGVYQYDPTRIQDAHSTNQKRVWNAAKEGRSPIIIDNTNIEAWEMRPYAAMAVENGYIVEILEPNTPWARNVNELAKKNTHNVPKSKIRERYQRYERGLTGETLLQKYSLHYSAQNSPPQLRKIPPITTSVEAGPAKVPPTMADFKSNWGGNDKNNVVLTTLDIESMQSIDESHGSMGLISECASNADDSSGSSTNPERTSTSSDKNSDEFHQDLQDSDDESFEMLDGSSSHQSTDVGNNSNNAEDSHNGISRQSPEVSAMEYADAGETSSNESQQIFGAIGSERKGSLSVASSLSNIDVEKTEKIASDNNDNVLSQCWDFTLLLGRYKIHSTLPGGHKIHETSKIEKDSKDEMKDRKILRSKRRIPQASADATQNTAAEPEGIVVNPGVDNDCERKNEEFAATEDSVIQKVIDRESSLEIDENSTTGNIAESENRFVVEQENKDTSPRVESTTIDPLEKNVEIDSSLLRDALGTEDPSDDRPGAVADDATKIAEEREAPEDLRRELSALGNFFNLIKTSILGPAENASSVGGNHKVLEDVSLNDIDDRTADREDIEDKDALEDDIKNHDTVDFTDISEENSSQCRSESLDKTTSDNSDDKNIYTNLSTNPFRKEMLESRRVDDGEDPSLVTDNINRISWKESPFPVDAKVSFAVSEQLETEKKITKLDASTNTTYYDLNVSYVGGTSEPGYRELTATSRCINEGRVDAAKYERLPLKLMLDKSSMTNEENILAVETHPEKSKDPGDRTQELIELFPHIPIETLTAFYVQQCKRNFEWAVEVLLEDSPNEFPLKSLEIKRSSPESPDIGEATIDHDTAWKMEHERLKQRSHSSSPRHRRKRSKDFRSFSMDFPDDRVASYVESSNVGDEFSCIKDEDDEQEAILQQIYENAVTAACLPVEHAEIPETLSEEDNEDEIELNFGREFIVQLEKTFGNPDFAFPEEFTPSIRIKKSMAEELHALWIQSMYRQLNARHVQLDEMIAKDEAMARELHRAESMEPPEEPVVPNFEEIMDMEMALASYQNELKEKIARETPNDLASRLTRRMLYEALPDIDPLTLSEILKAHDGNFKETCETIETSTGRKISRTESLKKQQSLLDRINEETKNRGIEQNAGDASLPLIVVRPDVCETGGKSDKWSSKSALEHGREARAEADKQFMLRMDYLNKAGQAYRRGSAHMAACYSQLAKLHSENMQAAHATAAEAFLSAQIYANDSDNTLDLHNLFVPEALRALDIFLEHQSRKLAKSGKRSSTLFIITGRGARSNNGQSKIKPAVSKKLTNRNIRFTDENPGCLRVSLSKKNILD